MKLSPRLKKIVSLIDSSRVADIGTDHAFVPIFLAENRKMEKVIATDINSGPIAIAKRQVAESGFADLIEVRQGGGLTCLNIGEVDEMIIAGMGGELMVSILQESIEIAKSADKLILQPMSKSYELRSFLQDNGFEILEEALAQEERHIYEIMTVRYKGEKTSYTEIELKFGPLLLAKGGMLMEQHLAHKAAKCKKVLTVLEKRAGNRVREEEQLLSEEFAQLEEAVVWLRHRQS